MTDLTIPGTIVSVCVGGSVLWATKKLLMLVEEVIRNLFRGFAETRTLLDAHVADCMQRRQTEAHLAEQVANLDDKVCDLKSDISRLVDHLLK